MRQVNNARCKETPPQWHQGAVFVNRSDATGYTGYHASRTGLTQIRVDGGLICWRTEIHIRLKLDGLTVDRYAVPFPKDVFVTLTFEP